MVDDHSDILGGHLPKTLPPPYQAWLLENPVSTAVVAGLFVLVAYFVLWPALTQWRDRRYRKALRRRYGIPDDDERPFNVAFAAARARTQGDSEEDIREPSESEDSVHSRHGLPQAPALMRRQQEREEAARVRPPEVPPSAHHPPYVTQYDTRHVAYNAFPSEQSATLVGDSAIADHTQIPVQRGQYSSATVSPGDDLAEDTLPLALKTQGKRARDEQDLIMPEKKFRLSDGVERDDEADVGDPLDNMDVDVEVAQPTRGSKRSANIEDDEAIARTRANGRDKRARKGSHELSDEEMAGVQVEDDDEENVESRPAQRGRKRDRDDAESTFGGDDSLDEEEEERGSQRSRRRKRRTVFIRHPEDVARGQKRSRDDATVGSDEEADRPKRRDTRKKRGKQDDLGDPLLDTPLSNDPLCKGRQIGEEWEVHGVHYKVGPNGQRLRQELVKRSRSRFLMPKDSQHPDSRTNIDVYIEAWLSDEQYQAAKERGDLAWQDSSPLLMEPATPGDVPDSPSVPGKDLLWSSTSSKPDSLATQRGPFRQSIVTNMGLRLNPFQKAQAEAATGRRVASVYKVQPPPTPDASPKVRNARTYSKWEKQDLEAAAMAKIREKRLAEAAEAAEAKNTITFPPAHAAAPATAAPSSAPAVPTFSFTKPTEKASEKSMQVADDKTPAPLFGSASPSTPGTSSTAPTAAAVQMAPQPAKEAPKATSGATTSTSAPASSSVPNFFGIAGQSNSASVGSQVNAQPRATSSAPSTGAFSFGIKPAGNATTVNPFGGIGSTTQSSATPTSGATAKPMFSLGAPISTVGTSSSSSIGAKPAETATTGGTPSLLSRLGPQVSEATAAQPQVAATSATVPSKSPFGQPSAPAPATAAPQSAFASAAGTMSNAAPSGTATTSSTAPAINAPSAPKFSFGFSAKPASAPPTSSTPAAQGSTDAPKPFSSVFGAAPAPQGNADVTMSSGTPSQSSASALSGAPTPSAFGFRAPALGSGTTSNPFGAPASTTPNKPSDTNLFSTTPAGAPSSGSMFGSGTSKPADSAKSAFTFGATGGTPAFGGSNTLAIQQNAPGPFGATTTAPVAAPGGTTTQPSFSFNFGATSTPSSSTNTSNPFGAKPAATPVFGATSQPTANASGSGNTTSSSTPSNLTFFGSAPSSNQNQKQ